jgi:hypothetical protein
VQEARRLGAVADNMRPAQSSLLHQRRTGHRASSRWPVKASPTARHHLAVARPRLRERLHQRHHLGLPAKKAGEVTGHSRKRCVYSILFRP